jgi:hypothetical protein
LLMNLTSDFRSLISGPLLAADALALLGLGALVERVAQILGVARIYPEVDFAKLDLVMKRIGIGVHIAHRHEAFDGVHQFVEIEIGALFDEYAAFHLATADAQAFDYRDFRPIELNVTRHDRECSEFQAKLSPFCYRWRGVGFDGEGGAWPVGRPWDCHRGRRCSGSYVRETWWKALPAYVAAFIGTRG